MKWIVCCAAAAALVCAAPAQAGDVDFRPIDTNKFVVKPTKTAADLASGTINLLGRGAASSIEGNGYVKTINNLFSFKRREAKFQNGPSALPSPNLYPSTRYPNYNTPVMPTYQAPRR